jgi:glucose/arabinose dehydrogenase
MSRSLTVLALLCPLLLGGGGARAATQSSTYDFVQWRGGLHLPVALRFAPDGRLFYLEVWGGRIRVFSDTTAANASTWATVPINAGSERGLMGLAFHPAFPDSPYVYVFHTNPAPLVNRVARLTDQFGLGTDYTVIVDNLPSVSDKHNGGRIAFGPDGMLYVTMGENDVPAYAPDAGEVRGKILRYTPMGEPAPGNPFGAGNPAYARGVRNPFGLCFDPVAGYGFFTDNGPACDDKLNHLVAGANYGWGPGYACGSLPGGTLGPIERITPTIAPTGACVYRGSVFPELDGDILFCAFNDGLLRRVALHPSDPGLSLGMTEIAYNVEGDMLLDVTVGPDQGVWACGPTTIMRLYETTNVGGVGDPAAGRGLSPAPNPFSASLAMRLPPGAVLDRLEALDLGGRRVRSWSGPLSGTVAWDGRDDRGRPVPAGVYLLRGAAAGRLLESRVVRLTP